MFRLLPFLLLLFCHLSAFAQDHRLLTLDDQRYEHIKKLQQRGYLLELHPTALPYTYQEIRDAVNAADESSMSVLEKRWLSFVLDPLKQDVPDDHIRLFGEAGGGVRLTDSRRLDMVRPLNSDVNAFQRLYVKAAAVRGRWTGQVGLVHDGYYDRDPDGIDVALRAQSRAENGFVGFNDGAAAIYVGRFANQWGVHGESATLISDNARAFDQINFRFGGERFSFRSFFAELDAITGDGRFTGSAGADSVQSGLERRFLFGHRFDLRPNRKLALTIMESVLISGPGTGLSLRFLNPLTAIGFENDNVPKNDENNALLGLILWWQSGRTTLHAQVMMDDLDVLHLGSERTSVAGTATLRRVMRQAPVDAGLGIDVVASRTYNTHQPEGQYVYLLRGLAMQYNDFAHIQGDVNWYADEVLPGFVVGARVHLLAQGEQRITAEFPLEPEEAETFLSGTVERTRRAALVVAYQGSRYWWVRLNGGVNRVTNAGHVVGAEDTRFAGVASLGLRIPINGSDVLGF